MLRYSCLCTCSWLREQHEIAGAINALFAPNLKTRIKQTISNPLFEEGVQKEFDGREWRRDGSLVRLAHDRLRLGSDEEIYEDEPVDILIKNPLFGSGLQLEKVTSSL